MLTLIVVVMANLQNLEQMAYSSVSDFFKVLQRRGWVKQASTNRILVLLFAVQFWWKYSVLMTAEDVRDLQRLFNCLGLDCLIPSMTSQMHDKVVINKWAYDSDLTALMSEDGEPLMSEIDTRFMTPEDNPS